MKRTIPYLLLPLLFFFSCKKEHSATVKKYKVTYNLSGFTQKILGTVPGKKQINSLATNSGGTPASIDILHYYVYDATQTRVNEIYQDSTYSNFGSITDNLPAGTYIVVFVGGKTGLNMGGDNFTLTLPSANVIAYGANSDTWEDTFFYETTITVSGGDINQNVTMNRIVGELTFDITDKMPANASTITLSITKDYEFYSFKTQTPTLAIGPKTFIFPLPAAALGASNYKHSILMLNTTTPFDATITCYDASNKPLGQATITGITLQANTQTILSGNLFGANTGFTTTLNHAWDPTPINYPF